tara:strand:+ start:207 stop:347 length:141 start_codon:yes stop_codon:yes gene_type:complete
MITLLAALSNGLSNSLKFLAYANIGERLLMQGIYYSQLIEGGNFVK